MRNLSIVKTAGLSYYHSKHVQTLYDINLNVEKEQYMAFLAQTVQAKQLH
jgi:hypothetical protein